MIQTNYDPVDPDYLTQFHCCQRIVVLFVATGGVVSDYYRNELKNSTPLHVAVRSGKEEIVKFLIEKGANVNARSLGSTPLHVAVTNGREEIVKFLIEKGTNVNAKDMF
ncbi:26S proteasome non-ATPase regulatory subunit 10-like [Dysidea avara]|uniref:26S proteasome non-ATPase regulatory subunit 10-like n=1 Tax=Dysidea avara TaxID=196820 RepID=UPI0033215E58